MCLLSNPGRHRYGDQYVLCFQGRVAVCREDIRPDVCGTLAQLVFASVVRLNLLWLSNMVGLSTSNG